MNRLIAVIAVVISLAAALIGSSTTTRASDTSCTPEQFAQLVDQTGAYLRDFSVKQKPALLEKFDELARVKGWPAGTAQEKGYRLVQDKQTTALDEKGRKLLIELDKIGTSAEAAPDCRELERLKTVTIEIRAVTEAKFQHMLRLANLALQADDSTTKTAQPAAKAAPAPTRAEPRTSRAGEPPSPNTTQKNAGQSRTLPWQTTTEQQAPPPPPAPPTVALRALPQPEPAHPDRTFSVAEIREAGRGLFGNITAGLASVIQYTFENYGAPNGYIVGNEGGGAFLAGLSFGQGVLYSKDRGPMQVYWQGPTVGYDLGLQGSRVLFLVYNLAQPEDIFARYGGIGGSAYIVGGVGLTYHMRGRVVLAPIRTGLGLRLGANIGYLKFTPRLSINPF